MTYKSDELVRAIRNRRIASGMSQRALSARSGLTQAHISQIETGSVEPGLGSFIEMARALDLEPVLVPKKLLPAVDGILQSQRIELSPQAGEDAMRTLSRGERLVAKQKQLYGSSADLDRIGEGFRFLKSAPLRVSDIQFVRNAVDTLARVQASPQSRGIVANIAADLQKLRNRIAHGPAEAPRPAYAFDEEDDDA